MGDALSETYGLYPILCIAREEKMREMAPQLKYVAARKHMIPSQFYRLREILNGGTCASYRGAIPCYPRIRVLPYQCADQDNCLFMGGNVLAGYSGCELIRLYNRNDYRILPHRSYADYLCGKKKESWPRDKHR